MPHYSCFGDDWPPGVVPECKYCHSPATWQLPAHDGDALLCDGGLCHAQYIAAEGYAIEYWEEPAQWCRCKACNTVWVFVDETCTECPTCSSDDPEILDERTLIARRTG